MTKPEIDLVNHAITLLRSLTGEPQAANSERPRCPVQKFVEAYLTAAPDADAASEELWAFYQEVAQAGELPSMRKAVFRGRLPGIMESVYGVRKCHNVLRDGRRVRGFRGVAIRLNACLPEPQV
jgi:hypothetical protein